ncbi:hypothetical protein RAK27_11935 [Carnobacterium maltaromaticum]|uniref:YopX protein domain-containing protein n=1 Tax=Carnobacterium maltaromaticum TaxID=2751 RepID=A0AAW9K5A1_CARML|nr:hypothetical protein [Carnobacterium maltaromaticum]MDZ5759374.1 hypothetical protein [Carnobacterium maltaromaticum]
MVKKIKITCWNKEVKYNQIFYYDGSKLLNMNLEKTDWKALQSFESFGVTDIYHEGVAILSGVNFKGIKGIVERVWDEQVNRAQVKLF